MMLPVGWEFPGLDALDDVALVFAVDGIVVDTGAGPAPDRIAPQPRVVHLNRAAAQVLGVPAGPVDGLPPLPDLLAHQDDADRIVAVASTGHPDSWVSHQVHGWFAQRAVPLATPRPHRSADGHGITTHVLVVARALGALPLGGGDEEGATRAALLLQISRRLGASVREEEVAEVVCDLVCPALGARQAVLAVRHEADTVQVLRRDGGTPLGALLRHPPRPVDADLLDVVWTGRQRLDTFPTSRSGWADRRAPREWTSLSLPLRAGSSTVGALSLRLDGRPELTRARQEFLDTVAALVAQAVQRARLFDVQLEANLALQHALLPPGLPVVPGLDLAARYRPGSGNDVGGDWYDVVPLPNGWTGLVIGDVQGHDLAAAAMMGQVRSVVRAYLLDQQPPTAVLSSVNAFVLSLGLERLVTACLVLAHPGSRAITVASAGHAMPVQLSPGRPGRLLQIRPGPPLGALDRATWRERTTLLPAEVTLLLHTDGLIERRTRSYADGEERLLAGAAGLPVDDVERLADGVLRLAGLPGGAGSGRDPIEDDTALLLMRWNPVDLPEPGHQRSLPVTPSSAVIARWYVEDLLGSWGVDEAARETTVLLTDELVSNAVRHAHRVIRLDVSADPAQVRVEVFDDSHREPERVNAPADATSGRGLHLVDALADAWGVSSSDGDLGKTVWFTVRRSPAAPSPAAPGPTGP